MKIVLATHNESKITEMRQILSFWDVELLSLEDIGFKGDIKEPFDTFELNSLEKAKVVSRFSNLPAIADDSGLMVDYLDGAPGVYTARYGGENLNTSERNNYLLNLMKDCEKNSRRAKFVSVITMYYPDGKIIQTKAEVLGEIAFEQKGDNGFAYDKVFLYEGKTFAEHDSDFKNQISHRAKAIEKFKQKIEEEGL